MRVVLITLFFSLVAWSQYSEQPKKESSSDLRSHRILFSLEETQNKKIYQLERTANHDYFLRLKKNSEEIVKKIASREASKLDMDFASRFLRCQYEIPSSSGPCKVTLRLSMKGETQDICEKDDKKSQEMASFLTELSKRF